MASLRALKPTGRIVDSVHDALRAAIFDGALRPGEALSVPELSRQLQVSRSPVREAVLALVGDGLAVEQPRRGVAVAEIDQTRLLEIYEVRQALEPQAAALCAARAGKDTFRRLAALLERAGSAVAAEDLSAWSGCNDDFHRMIAEGAGNRQLAGLIAMLQGQMRLGLRGLSFGADHPRRALREQLAVTEAIGKHNSEDAFRLMREHIERSRQILLPDEAALAPLSA